MRRWELITGRDFPMWTISRSIVERRKLSGGRIRRVVEIPDNVRILPTGAGIISISAAGEATDIAA